MISKKNLVVFIFLIPLLAFGQNKSDYQWIMGNGEERSLIIDFNDGFSQHYVDSPISLSLTIAQICSEVSGELLFYTNGCDVIDSSFHVMEGGAMINNSELADYFCLLEGGYYPGFHSSIVLPHPGNLNQYYYLHKTVSYGDGNCDNLNYALIDLSLNDGKGAVVEKYQNIIQHDRLACGMVHAVRHANGRDWWSIQGRSDQGKYYKVLVDETGPHLHDIQDVGAPVKTVSGSQAIFSHDGSIFAVMDYIRGLQLFDFDRETGQLSNYQFLELPVDLTPTGICFSPNNRFLYVFFTSNIYQIDLWSDPPQPLFITTRDSTVGNPSSFYTNFGWGLLGPDCKIYVAPASGVDVLHVIHNPNEYGQACDFRHQDIPLIYPRSLGPMPNMPNFRIDDDDLCDPLLSTSIEPEHKHKMAVYPNPSQDKVSVEVDQPGRVQVFDVMGQVILSQEVHGGRYGNEVDVSTWHKGIYWFRYVGHDGRTMVREVVKM